jgi:hypothetical protein
MKNSISFSGILILASFLLTLYSYFFSQSLIIVAGLLAWFAFIILFITIVKKKMIITLLFLSFIAFSFSYYNDFEINFIKVFTVNQYLLTLLIGVGFLRLIASPKKDKLKKLPIGKQSFLKTYIGVHLFGSVINLSSLILVADKLYKKAPLSNTQIVLLTRAFASDAYWSPFFVAFAAAITYAPNLTTSIILINGVFLAFIAFAITYYEVSKNEDFKIAEFRGYPLSLDSLYLPLVLAFFVLITNYYFPNIKVIVLIALFSLVLTFLVLPIKKGFNCSIEKLKNHVFDDLPKMKLEMSLFLVAGMFGISISSILLGLDLSLPFEKFDWIISSILLAIFILLAFVGIHPIITIAIIGDFLSSVNHTLLAVTFLMAWSTTVSTSPFSGLNLTIVARYKVEGSRIFKLNILYALKMYIVCVLFLFLLSNYLQL